MNDARYKKLQKKRKNFKKGRRKLWYNNIVPKGNKIKERD